MIGRFKVTLKDLVFPHMCLRCSAWPGLSAERFCPTCVERLDRERDELACPTCGKAVAKYEVYQDRCAECRQKPTRLAGTVRVGPYGRALGALVRAYKYHGREELEAILAGWLADVIKAAPWLKRVQAVVSVPTHWRHRLGRPLYAADMLAALVARQIHLPHLPILRRVRAGPHQIGLSYTDRTENVRGAFAMRKGVTLRNARLLLIDDVKTTGATLEECTKVLRRGGAAEVYGAVVVKVSGVRPGSRPPASI